MATRANPLRCPICGEGVLADLAYDEHSPKLARPKQAPESVEVLTFSCGHEVTAEWLGDAARDDPNVERRRTTETVDPISREGGAP